MSPLNPCEGRDGHRVYCVRARHDETGQGRVLLIVMTEKGSSYRLFPRAGDLAATLLRDVRVPDFAVERIARALDATPLLHQPPPWDITETEIRAFAGAAEAFR